MTLPGIPAETELSTTAVLDTETTGLWPGQDEILQLAIIRLNGAVLFNDYFRPERHRTWKEAQAIHGITPEMVADKATFRERLPEIQQALFGVQKIVAYNIGFDIPMLRSNGLELSENVHFYDVMLEFAPIYGEWNDYFGDFKWQKLSTCANYYDYKSAGRMHDALEDCLATAHCYKAMKNASFGSSAPV